MPSSCYLVHSLGRDEPSGCIPGRVLGVALRKANKDGQDGGVSKRCLSIESILIYVNRKITRTYIVKTLHGI